MKCKYQKQKKILKFSQSLPREIQLEFTQQSNLIANKRLGQNFLCDATICDQIALSCGNLTNSIVIEIGPGIGNLTQSILALHHSIEIFAIEKDIRFISMLEKLQNYYTNNTLHIVLDDALSYNFQSLICDKKIYIISNLPYNIGTTLLFKWLNSEFLQYISNITIMLQSEVAKRINALPSTKSYSWLSILSQLLCDIEILFDVPKEAFTPMPKVTSSVISLTPKKKIIPHNINNLRIICHELFLHRRKTLYSIIKHNEKLHYLLNIDYINFNDRPENLNIETFCKLSLEI